MPKLSAFTRMGHLRMSAKPSYPKAIYDSIVKGEQAAFDMTRGTPREATAYARAHGFARMRNAIERAGNQRHPRNCNDLLPDYEERFGLIPGEFDGLTARQNALAAKMLASRGARRESVVAALRAILGADFLALRVVNPAEVGSFPPNPAAGVTNCVRPGVAPKFLQLVDPITFLGSPIPVLYENLDTTLGDILLAPGDVVVVQAGHSGLQEKVTVASVSGAGATRTFTATFTKPHDIGAIVTTMNYPYEWSTQRTLLVVVKSAAAIDPVRRQKIHEAMRLLSRGTDTWAIVRPSTPGALTIGPLTIGSSILGTTTIGTVSFTPDP